MTGPLDTLAGRQGAAYGTQPPPPPPVPPRYGTVAAAGPFAGRGGWWSYGNQAIGTNLTAAIPALDWLAFKYPLDNATPERSAAFVHDIVRPQLRPGQRVIAWEQDSVVGSAAVASYMADGWIGVGESPYALARVQAVGAALSVPSALATTFVPSSWPPWAVAMFELYQGDGTPILDNTPLAQLAALGAPAVCPIVGGFRNVPLTAWFPQLAGQGFPGASGWTVDAYPQTNVDLLARLPV